MIIFLKKNIIKNLLFTKFSKYESIKKLILKTYLRPINYLFDNIEIGCYWEQIRHNYLLK